MHQLCRLVNLSDAVDSADIVVLLVRGEVRNGTATSATLAIKHKKPMLIYFS